MVGAVVEVSAAIGMSEDEARCELFSTDASGDPLAAEVFGTDERLMLHRLAKTLLEAIREADLETGSACETEKCGIYRVAVRAWED